MRPHARAKPAVRALGPQPAERTTVDQAPHRRGHPRRDWPGNHCDGCKPRRRLKVSLEAWSTLTLSLLDWMPDRSVTTPRAASACRARRRSLRRALGGSLIAAGAVVPQGVVVPPRSLVSG